MTGFGSALAFEVLAVAVLVEPDAAALDPLAVELEGFAGLAAGAKVGFAFFNCKRVLLRESSDGTIRRALPTRPLRQIYAFKFGVVVVSQRQKCNVRASS